jgi:hypothetical protein
MPPLIFICFILIGLHRMTLLLHDEKYKANNAYLFDLLAFRYIAKQRLENNDLALGL